MKADEIAIKIYNMSELRLDLGEKWIKEYAMNVAKEAYIRGYEHGHNIRGYENGYKGLIPDPSVELSEIDPDNYN